MDSYDNFKEGELLYQDQHLVIRHCPSYKAIYIKLSGYIEEEDTANLFACTLGAVDQSRASFLIGDFSNFKGSNLHNAKYAGQIWIPKLAAKGISHVAMNKPKSDFGAFTLKIAMGQKAHTLFEIQHFSELGKGISWLKELAENN